VRPSFPRLTRRAAFAIAAAIPGVALANDGAPLPTGMSPRWRALLLSASRWHPNGFEVASMAYEAGFDIDDLAGISLSGDCPRAAYPIMFFDAHNGGLHSVYPGGVLRRIWVRP
jgi:hypothetical protein